MTGADCYIATISNGQVSVDDYYNREQDTPEQDSKIGGVSNLILGRGTIGTCFISTQIY